MLPRFARRKRGYFRLHSLRPLLPLPGPMYSQRLGLLLLLLVYRILGQPTLATAFVQSASDNPLGIATTVAKAFTANVAAGAVICGAVTWGSSTVTVTVADNLNGAHTVVQTVTDTTNNQRNASFYVKNAAPGATTVTVTFSAAVGFRILIIHEVSGADTIAPLDGNAGQWQTLPGTAADGVTSTNFTPANNGCYIFGASINSNAGGTLVSGTGYTQRVSVGFGDAAANLMVSEDKIQATAAAVAATLTAGTSTDHLTVGMAFKPAAAVTAVAGVKEVPTYGPLAMGTPPAAGWI